MKIYLYNLGLWRELILKQKGVITDDLDVSSLAKVSDGYTPGHIIEIINQILSERRKQQVKRGNGILFLSPWYLNIWILEFYLCLVYLTLCRSFKIIIIVFILLSW